MNDSLTMKEHALLVKLLEREADYLHDEAHRSGQPSDSLDLVLSTLEKVDTAEFVFLRTVR